MQNSIALLATGDEIVAGDILNTNSQEIAHALFHEKMFVSQHQSVRDQEEDIARAILSLLEHNKALIITGGLGPTTDDRTRLALATAIQRPLYFDETVWQGILDRFFIRYGQTEIPLSNRQQAFFPEGATIFPNRNGSAAGCLCLHDNKMIFMLPGPPHECLPMFHHYVLPALKASQFMQNIHSERWQLFGVSEAYIAEQLEYALQGLMCQTGYRAMSSYVEFKLFADHPEILTRGINAVKSILLPYLKEGK
ncbi:MAG: competence/damage-inducible protein A [Gammaproteobacteria bacterium]|nr:competence/damage-inducible protein A [Gammaproteobacteria bacterium]MCD8542959.1 competence/damage-inducible protein A [Gammaproteobacteria bacterium]